MKKVTFILVFFLVLFQCPLWGQLDQLMPVPKSVEVKNGKYRLDKDFKLAIRQKDESRVTAASTRFLQRLDGRTGLNLPDFADNIRFPINGLNVWVKRSAPLKLNEDESYSLNVSATMVMLEAETDLGAMHGMETLLQLLSVDEKGYYFPACFINDEPRFPWRGLLIDVCRHWQPVDVIKRNLDAMAAMKMNVFHWHLSEDQGFRIESKVFPKLHEMGSDGNYFTQEQVKDIISYAGARGIRVIPEFDMPGHATSWFVGHPELASAPGPYSIEKKFGVFDPAMDPTKESTYQFLQAFLGEMCQLFPDEYFHIGGDENNGKQWDANPEIQAFMQENHIKDNHELQAYFNKRLLDILSENGKRMVGWDEILQEGIPKNIVIQSWRGKEALVKAAKSGYSVMLSNGYYIDLCQTAAEHYLNDPVPEGTKMNEEELFHVLGGEATMWGELISPETIDSRIWPRTCAIAERLWSPQEVRDVADMYRRLDLVSLRLEELGLMHIKNQDMMMRRLTMGESVTPLKTLVDVIEPLKIYNRHRQGVPYSTELPLSRLADIAVPDAPLPRYFAKLVDQYIADPNDLNKLLVQNWLVNWKSNHIIFTQLAEKSPVLMEALPMSEKLNEIAIMGTELLSLEPGTDLDPSKAAVFRERLKKAKEPVMEAELMVVAPIEKLLNAKTSRK